MPAFHLPQGMLHAVGQQCERATLYYDNFLKLRCFKENDIIDIEEANCRCPAGETQSSVHVAGLLLT